MNLQVKYKTKNLENQLRAYARLVYIYTLLKLKIHLIITNH